MRSSERDSPPLASAAVVLLLLLYACGLGSNSTTSAPTTSELTAAQATGLTVDYDGEACSITGPPGLWQGTNNVTLRNKSSDEIGIGLIRLDDGRSWEEFESYVEEALPERDGIPDWSDVVAELLPGTLSFTDELDFGLGTYGVFCYGGPDGSIIPLGELATLPTVPPRTIFPP